MTRLTEEMVVARSKQSDLSAIKKLNCWGSDLSDVSIIKRMRGVEVLALSVNKISTLQPFEDCTKLQELYLRKNNIQDINEIAYLQNLPALKFLWLAENPCCDRAGPKYRSIVLHALPNLKKLDNVEVTQEEIDDAMRLAESFSGGGGGASPPRDEEIMDDGIEQQAHEIHDQHHQQQSTPQQTYQQQQQLQHRQQFHQQQQHHHQQPTPPQQYCARRSSSPLKEEYYQSDRPAYSAHYRHSQTDLTEWEEHHQHNQYASNATLYHGPRRSAGAEREIPERYAHRNGHARENGGDWEEMERSKPRRFDGRFNDSASTVSTAVFNHYSGYHRRPLNRTSNLLSATLCLVKELDYSSLEVVEHAVRCRIDELSSE